MEFFYEEQALANDPHKKEDHDEKTEEAFHKIEEEVNKKYEDTTKALKNFVGEAEDGVKLNLPIDSEVSERAQRYLGQLDSNLQNVEKAAQGYWTKVSNPGFWSNVSNNLSNRFEQMIQLGEDRAEGGGTDDREGTSTVVGGNRTETELKMLSTDKSIYLDNDYPGLKDFDADSKTEEISQILEKNKDLANLMNAIVPQEISYKDFWNVYFIQRQRIFEMENTRRKILENKESNKEEEIGWDEEEDDSDKQDEEPVIIKKEDTAENDGAGKEKRSEDRKPADDKTGADADAHDDDWE